LFGAVIFFSSDRRRATLLTGHALLAVGLLTLFVIFLVNQFLATSAEERTVARELVKALEGNLEMQSLLLMLLGAGLVAMSEPRIRATLANAESRAFAYVRQLDARFLLASAALLAIVLFAA
jgi:hypothetical protein